MLSKRITLRSLWNIRYSWRYWQQILRRLMEVNVISLPTFWHVLIYWSWQQRYDPKTNVVILTRVGRLVEMTDFFTITTSPQHKRFTCQRLCVEESTGCQKNNCIGNNWFTT